MKKMMFFPVAEMSLLVSNRTKSAKNDFPVPLISGLGATRRAAMTLLVGFKAQASDDGAIYDLSGRKVSADYKGIVVKNGKKYVKK